MHVYSGSFAPTNLSLEKWIGKGTVEMFCAGRTGFLCGVIWIALLLTACTSVLPAENSEVLHSIAAIQSSERVRSGALPDVDLQATVIYDCDYERRLFVQDGNHALFVQAPEKTSLRPGDRIRIRGRVAPGFRPLIESNSIQVVGHAALPKPVVSGFSDLIRARYDCRLVTVRGRVLGANIVVSKGRRSSRLYLAADTGIVEAVLDNTDTDFLRSLLDAQVELTGTVSGIYDGKWTLTGSLLYLNTRDSIRFLRHASVDPWSLPFTPMQRILDNEKTLDLTPRIRVHGVITYYQPGTALVLQDGQSSLWIQTNDWRTLHVGHRANAIGIPTVHDGFLNLKLGEAREEPNQTQVLPLSAHWSDLSSRSHSFDLVSLKGVLVTSVHESAQDEYILSTDGHLVTALFRHPQEAMKQIPAGSRVQITGICIPESVNPFNGEAPFIILLRNFDDVTFLSAPSLFNVRNLMNVIGLMTLVLFLAILRSWFLERKVRQQTMAIAHRNKAEALLEKQRSRILEMINRSRPLEEILDNITSVASVQLAAVSCWFQGSDGSRYGDPPTHSDKPQHILEQSVKDLHEHNPGTIFASFDSPVTSLSDAQEVLAGAAQLIAMAIETQRLNSDLRHRSEFDQLTDIYNRFSLDRYLETCIQQAQKGDSPFALLYIDLDDFKQVNDRYGHHIGDLFLQVVAQRIQSHLRSCDMLARLGGDEFAVLVPGVRNRSEAREIVRRICLSFNEPIRMDELLLYAEFSAGIALCPEDGVNPDALLLTADQAMYKIKHHRKKSRDEERSASCIIENSGSVAGISEQN